MSIGFKEWALVCAALGRGEQSILLRKGGIAEGREGFRFRHPEFFLFPTLFHEQVERTRLPRSTPLPAQVPGQIHIRWFARVEWTELVTDRTLVRRLKPFHILAPSVVEERFRYEDSEGIHIAFLRVFELVNPGEFEDLPSFGGCRSWLELPDPPADLGMKPVLDDPAHAARGEELRRALGQLAEV